MKKLLVLGGSGGLSGCLARTIAAKGWEVWTMTRGKRKLPEGVHSICADRNQEKEAEEALRAVGIHWDAVLDCICMNAAHAAWDLRVLPELADRLVAISTDSVYEPLHKTVPQTEETEWYMEDDTYAGSKRKMELEFLHTETKLPWTIFRPGHIYGPGFLIGCYPEESRREDLLERIRKDEPMRLVGGGEYRIHPIYVQDLADAMLDCLDKEKTFWEIFCIGGPQAVPNRVYYEIIGQITGHPVQIEEIPLEGYLEAHPEYSGHLCERSYSLEKLRQAGVKLPSTALEEGLRNHIRWLDTKRTETEA